MQRLTSLRKSTQPVALLEDKRTQWLALWDSGVICVSVVEGNSYDDDAVFNVELLCPVSFNTNVSCTFPRVTETALAGDRLYVFSVSGKRQRLTILGLPTLDELAVVEDFELEERPSPLAVDGRLYVRVGNTLRVYDDSVPPVLLGEVGISWKKAAGFRGLVSLGRGRIAVAGSDDRTGIQVIDVAGVGSPTALGGWTASSNFQDQLASVGDLVLSYGIGNKALLYQLKDDQLVVLGTVPTPDRFMYHLVDGNRVLLYGGRNKSRGKGLLLSVSDRGLAKEAVSFPDETEPNAVVVDRNQAYVGSDWGLAVYRL